MWCIINYEIVNLEKKTIYKREQQNVSTFFTPSVVTDIITVNNGEGGQNSNSGKRTLVSHVIGEDTNHYTNEDLHVESLKCR